MSREKEDFSWVGEAGLKMEKSVNRKSSAVLLVPSPALNSAFPPSPRYAQTQRRVAGRGLRGQKEFHI